MNKVTIIFIIGGIVLATFFDAEASTTAKVTIPEGASTEGSNHFDPETLTVAKGTTVEWLNDDTTIHTVTSGSPQGSSASGTKFDSSYLASGDTFKQKFSKNGTYKYYCTLHPYMTAKIVVSKDAEASIEIETVEKQPSIAVDTTINTNSNVTDWKNFTDSENRFSVGYPSHWAITQSGNRFTQELPLVANDVNGSSSKIQSQLSVNIFKSDRDFSTNGLAKFAFNDLVDDVSGNQLVEPISCNKYKIGGSKACHFVYSGNDQEGKRYGVLTVVIVDEDDSNHIISYKADPLNFDSEQATVDHIIGSYRLLNPPS